MQRGGGGGCYIDGGNNNNNNNTMLSLLLKSHNQERSGSGSGSGYTSLDSSSITPPQKNFSPFGAASSSEGSSGTGAENRFYLGRLTLEYQQLMDRYTLCLTQLQDAAKSAEILRQENATLRIANKDLTKRLTILTQAAIQTRYLSSGIPSLSIVNDFRSLCLGDNGRDNGRRSEVFETSLNRFDEKKSGGGGGTERVALPKSISIRSSGYLKMNSPPPSVGSSSSGTTTNIANRPRALSPVTNEMEQQQPRMYVPLGSKEEGPLEFDVYNQGMLKTELCNKWQETGACPYGDHCQFAHGIAELRPVIRHPRYKTEVCRMVLNGENCPYGHRCHFRHALTDQEKLMRHCA